MVLPLVTKQTTTSKCLKVEGAWIAIAETFSILSGLKVWADLTPNRPDRCGRADFTTHSQTNDKKIIQELRVTRTELQDSLKAANTENNEEWAALYCLLFLRLLFWIKALRAVRQTRNWRKRRILNMIAGAPWNTVTGASHWGVTLSSKESWISESLSMNQWIEKHEAEITTPGAPRPDENVGHTIRILDPPPCVQR